MKDSVIRSRRVETWSAWYERLLLRPIWVPFFCGLFVIILVWWSRDNPLAAGLGVVLVGALLLWISFKRGCDHLFFGALGWLGLGLVSVILLGKAAFYIQDEPREMKGEIIGFLDREAREQVVIGQTDCHRSIVVDCHRGTRLLLKTKKGINCRIGDTVVFTSNLIEPDKSRNPGGFAVDRWLAGEKIFLQTDRMLSEDVTVFTNQSRLNIKRQLRSLRLLLSKQLIHWLGPDDGGLLSGMLLGVKDVIAEADAELFKQSGIAHLLVVSGGHTHIAVDVFLLIFALVGGRRTVKLIGKGIVLCCFGFLTGWGVGATRAILMQLLSVLASFLRRRGDPLNCLLTTCLLMMFFNPFVVLQNGFWLSTTVSGTLVVGHPILVKRFEESIISKLSLLRRIIPPFLAASIAAFVSLPLSLKLQKEFSLLLIPLNVVALPLAAIILSAGMILLICGWSSWLRPLVAVPLGTACRLLRTGAKWATKDIFIVILPQLLFGGFVICSFFIIWYLTTKGDLFKRGCLIFSSILVFTAVSYYVYPRPIIQLWFFDVGQGDAMLLQYRNKMILIDSGTSWAGEFQIEPALRALNVRQIDLAICTHLDQDHAGGMIYLTQKGYITHIIAPPREIIENKLPDLATVMADTDVNHSVIFRNNTIILTDQTDRASSVSPVDQSCKLWGDSDVKLTCLHPSEYTDGGNGDSLVMHMTWGDFDLLITGDIGHETEKQLLDDLIQRDREWEILWVSHHGSKYSSCAEFIATVSPKCSVIQVGRFNNYGHPADVVIDHLMKEGSVIHRTDYDGCIEIKVFPEKYMVVPWCHKEQRRIYPIFYK